MTRIAIIGAGRMGRAHAGVLRNIKGCEVAGVYDPVKKAADDFCAEFNVKKKYASENMLAKDTSVDGVVICNYTDQHARSLVRQLEAGRRHIFLEKPAVRTLKEGNEMLALAKRKKAAVMIGHHRRYIPGYARINEMVKAGELGTVRMAKVNWCSPGYSRDWDDFFANFKRSGGVIIDMMSHMFDQMNWDFGEPQSICGQGIMLDRSQPLPMDYVSGTLAYKNGPICNISCSWQRYGAGADVFEVYGDKACAVYSGGDILHVYRKNEHTEIHVGGATPIMEAFVDMVRNGTPPRVTLADGIEAVRVARGMIEAAQKNTVVEFKTFK